MNGIAKLRNCLKCYEPIKGLASKLCDKCKKVPKMQHRSPYFPGKANFPAEQKKAEILSEYPKRELKQIWINRENDDLFISIGSLQRPVADIQAQAWIGFEILFDVEHFEG